MLTLFGTHSIQKITLNTMENTKLNKLATVYLQGNDGVRKCGALFSLILNHHILNIMVIQDMMEE